MAAHPSCSRLSSQKQKVKSVKDLSYVELMREIVDDLESLAEVKKSRGEAKGDAVCFEQKKNLVLELLKTDAPKSRESSAYHALMGRFFSGQGDERFSNGS